MDPEDFEAWGFETHAVRAGQRRTHESEHNDPIFATSSFVFRDARQAAARFAEEEPGNIYARFTNPTVRSFEERLAALEGGGYAVGTASGMGAILTTCLAMLQSGDRVLASRTLFGASVSLFNNILARFGVETRFVPLVDLDAWAAAIDSRTRMLFVETPSNPLMEIADLEGLAELAHAHGCLLVVDNCVWTPALLRPLDLGADLVVHSGTKYLDGQGRCVGGAVVTRSELVRAELFAVMRTAGPSLSPFNAWVLLKGLETLRLRMQAHSERALALAQWLEQQPAVRRVLYPGLPSHPQHRLAARQTPAHGGVVAFEIDGGREAAWQVVDATRFVSITANFGDAKSTITHPASTTHGRLAPEVRAGMGIGEDLLRVSVGLERLADVQADLARGLERIAPPGAVSEKARA